MHSRLRNTRTVSLALLCGALFLVVLAFIFSNGFLFRYLSALLSSVTLSPPEEYELLPPEVLASRLADAERSLTRTGYQSALYGMLAEENKRLKETLALPVDQRVAVGRVIARPPKTHYDTLLLALSEGHGVEEGDFAFFEDVLLGEVSRTGPRSALVTLFSSGEERSDAKAGEPAAIVILEGRGAGAFRFEIPDEVLLSEGDLVVSAYDPSYTLAVVVNVSDDPDKTSRTVHARLPVAFPDIDYVIFQRPSTSTAEESL